MTLASMHAALDALTDERLRLPSDSEQLALLSGAIRLEARLHAWIQGLAVRIEESHACMREHGTSTVSWLAESLNFTAREATRLVKGGADLEAFPLIGRAVAQGHVLPQQAEAIGSVIRNLTGELPQEAIEGAQALMVELAGTHNSAELRRLTGYLFEVMAPEKAEELEAERLEREHRVAMRARHLEFRPDGCGSVVIRGSLPVAEAEPLIRVIDAFAEQSRGWDQSGQEIDKITPTMRRADGLVALVAECLRRGSAPTHGGDRPRVCLTLAFENLHRLAADRGLVGAGSVLSSGEPVAASVVRRLLCDAEVLPIVLGGPSEILDVGRSRRMVTGPIRVALEQRDGGCVFPGCSKPSDACEAHHIQPWWSGGRTCVENLVLVCPHHHGVVEPGHDPAADRWRIRIGVEGIPEILPPRRVDPEQRPRVHARFLARSSGLGNQGEAESHPVVRDERVAREQGSEDGSPDEPRE